MISTQALQISTTTISKQSLTDKNKSAARSELRIFILFNNNVAVLFYAKALKILILQRNPF